MAQTQVQKSVCCRTHQVLVITIKSKGNNNKPVLKVVTAAGNFVFDRVKKVVTEGLQHG
jgi:hypothetical protein